MAKSKGKPKSQASLPISRPKTVHVSGYVRSKPRPKSKSKKR